MNEPNWPNARPFNQGEDTLDCPFCGKPVITRDGYHVPSCDHLKFQWVESTLGLGDSFQYATPEVRAMLDEGMKGTDEWEPEQDEVARKVLTDLQAQGMTLVVLEEEGSGCGGPSFKFLEVFAFQK